MVGQAGAAQVDKAPICHGTGSESNPYVLIVVPTNSAHFTKHLVAGDDKLPVEVEGGLSCGGEDSPPTPPFTGTITFTLDGAKCADGEQGVPGFTVLSEQFVKGEYVLDVQGREIQETVLFVYPATCIKVGAGPTGPAGPAGPAGPSGTAGLTSVLNTVTTLPAGKCSGSRRFSLFLPVKQLRHAKVVDVTVAGKLYHMHPNKAGRVTINLTRNGKRPDGTNALKCGVYSVVVKTPKGVKGIDPATGLTRAGFFARIYTIKAGNVTAVNVPVPHAS
jgi:hypothetical protein